MHRALLIAAAACLLAGCEKPADNGWQGYIEGEFVLLASPYAGQLQKLYVRRGDAIEALPRIESSDVPGRFAFMQDPQP